jgi:TetR/AcrR family transcriptional regulator, transcriptional repressor for nem operon
MGHSQADKARNRERILDEAARQIRETGLEALSVGGLMQKVNLTHGGFYGHFESRSDLIAQALERALTIGEAQAQAARDPGKPRTFSAMIRSYLSRTHRDSRSSGCAIAALVSDVGRADLPSRKIMEQHIESFIAAAAAAIADTTDRGTASRSLSSGRASRGPVGSPMDDKRAMTAVSAMVGAIAISRVMTDPKRSDALLRAVRENIAGLAAE